MHSWRHWAFGLLTLVFIGTTIPLVWAASSQNNLDNPSVLELTLDQKRAFRKQLLAQMITKYNQNQVFPRMETYMIDKYHQLQRSDTPKPPSQLISDTLERSRAVYEKTRSFVGDSFKRVYNPLQIESTINRYLWLKGLCFLVMGINEEHKIALSFFYLPGNENQKREFLRDAVRYSFPEIQDVPANSPWFDQMEHVMDRLCFRLFNIDKYCPKSNPTPAAASPTP